MAVAARMRELGWEAHADSLMWPFVVEGIDEFIEPGLLLQEILSGRFGGLQFQGQVHTLVTAILLRMARLDAFDRDAEA